MDIVSSGPMLMLSGDFDVRSTMQVRAALYERLAGAEQDVVIDLTDVTTIDATALRLLAAASLTAGQHGHHLTLRGCNSAVLRMLHLTRLMRFVELDRVAATA
jgi:anti-anti-sigma factor